MKKFKSYSFWVALASAVVVLLNALGRAFGFSIQNKVVEDVILSLASLLVVLGIVNMDTNKTTKNANEQEVSDDEQNAQEKTQDQAEQEISAEQEDFGEKSFCEKTFEEKIVVHAEPDFQEENERLTGQKTSAEQEPSSKQEPSGKAVSMKDSKHENERNNLENLSDKK